jgi:hypothetical protein
MQQQESKAIPVTGLGGILLVLCNSLMFGIHILGVEFLCRTHGLVYDEIIMLHS